MKKTDAAGPAASQPPGGKGGGLWDYDVAADDLFCNARWYEIMGLDPSRATVRTLGQFRPLIHPDDAIRATAIDLHSVSELIAQDEPYHVEFRVIRPDGTIRWVRSVACIVEDRTTGHVRAVGCVTDITDAVSADAAPELAPSPPPPPEVPRLTDKERECLRWVSVGKTAWETAVIVGRSRRTVEFHLGNAVAKLGAANKIHAAAIAIRLGIL